MNDDDDPKHLNLPALLEQLFDELPAHVVDEGYARIKRREVVYGITAQPEEAATVFKWAGFGLVRVEPNGWWERASYDRGSLTAHWPFDGSRPTPQWHPSDWCSERPVVGMPAIEGEPGQGYSSCQEGALQLRRQLAKS